MMLAVVFAAVLTQGGDQRVVRAFEQIEQRLATSWRDGDCAGWGALLAPEWSVIHFTGDVLTKAEALETCKARRGALKSLDVDDLSVRTFRDAAVVTGRTTAVLGEPDATTLTLRFTDVFVSRAGRWQVVASQATQVTSSGKGAADRFPKPD
jgi:Domain of unknown function (DUF4440)